MDELQETLHKFDRAAAGLGVAINQIDTADPDPDAINIALAQAKKVRRESNIVVRALARLRDHRHSQEADTE